MTYSITPLLYARQQVPGPQVFFQSDWNQQYEFAFYVFLIRGNGITALIDCGVDDPSLVNEVVLRTALGEAGLVRAVGHGHTVTGLLAAQGLRPEDIDVVAITHFHWDHITNISLFPRARFLISKQGWQEYTRLTASAPDMLADPIFPHPVLDWLATQHDRLNPTEDGPTLLPGIDIRHTGGHTPDSAAFVVPTDAGTVIMPGDTIWTYSNLTRNHPIGAATSIEQCYQAMHWARDRGDLIMPSHDPVVLSRYPRGIGQP
jgi:glyoxylase-like metal-dependent hydrolase (beta-lactamase superfamily II)